MHIGMNIRKIRKEKNLTQKQVAEKCGMLDSNLRTYESGRMNPKPATIARIAKALDVSPAALYGVETRHSADAESVAAICQAMLDANGGAIGLNEPGLYALVTAFDALNEAGRRKLVEYAKDLVCIPHYGKPDEETEVPGDDATGKRNDP